MTADTGVMDRVTRRSPATPTASPSISPEFGGFRGVDRPPPRVLKVV